MADLKVTIREELTLNDYDHGARNSLVIADIDEVFSFFSFFSLASQ